MKRPEVRFSVLYRMGAAERRLVCSECGPLKRCYPTKTDAAIARKEHSFAHTQGLL